MDKVIFEGPLKKVHPGFAGEWTEEFCTLTGREFRYSKANYSKVIKSIQINDVSCAKQIIDPVEKYNCNSNLLFEVQLYDELKGEDIYSTPPKTLISKWTWSNRMQSQNVV